MMGQNPSIFWNGARLIFGLALVLGSWSAPAAGLPLVRQANTTLQMPLTPPVFGYNVVDAFPGVSFTFPLAIVSPPAETNRLFIVEQTGKIFVITNLASPNKTLFLDIGAKVTGATPSGEQGLLSLAFHPDYASNGFFYVVYCSQENLAQGNGFYNRLSRYRVSATNANVADASSELPILVQYDEHFAHNMNQALFGPDGYLYVSIGDEGDANDSFNNAQRIDKDFFSGILRLDVDKRAGNLPPNPHPASTTNYFVPADNPFVGTNSFNGIPVDPGNVRTEFWAVGLRNPWRMSFDPVTGELYAGDVGQSDYEEINVINKGGNYGWAYREGDHPGSKAGSMPGGFASIPPIYEYTHGVGTNQGFSVTGGVVYRGTKLAQLYGAYVFADYGLGNLWKFAYDGTNVTQFAHLTSDASISTIGTDPRDGDILIANINDGKIKRLVYNSTPVGTPIPPTLAQTGIYSNLVTLQPNAGVVPYGLALPFWSDNAIKTRWFSVPNTNLTIGFNADGNWSFPTGTVWVKHFEIEMTNGVASSKRRQETRVVVKNSNGIYGVTYKWDASQTNATLVPEAGLTESLVINDGGGLLRTQQWAYPSRSQCLACHTAVGGHAPGFNTRQLNREFNYSGTLTNQIRAFADAGYFTSPPTNYAALGVLAHYTNTAVSLEYRFRSYLQANCAQCHQPGGSGRGQWDARITTPMDQANILNGLLAETFGNVDNRVIKPGSLSHSFLLRRISSNDSLRMPPLGSTVLDTNAIALVQDFIRSRARILPLGDSITAGYGGQNSYRRPLWQMLTNAGFAVDYVGTLTNDNGTPPPNPDFDLNHEGHSGYRADDIVNNLPAWLPAAASNDIVLLHIGTNDRLQGQDNTQTTNEINQIVNLLRGSNPNVAVFLAQILPYSLPWSGGDTVPDLNTKIAALAAAKSNATSPVILVNQNSGFNVATDTFDQLHPNAAGEQKMAAKWFAALSQYLTGHSNVPPAVTLVSPADGTTLLAPATFTLAASASDSDGAIATVEFFANGNKVGEATNAPYTSSWTNVAVGNYSVIAVATDNSGAKATSIVASVTSSLVPPYYRGVNLGNGGGAVVIEGQPWFSHAAALTNGLSIANGTSTGGAFPFTPSPPADANTVSMLETRITRLGAGNGQGFTLTQTITNGSYFVWLWTIENNSSGYRNMNVLVEGAQVATNIGDLPYGQWAKYGPYLANVVDGALSVEVRRATKGEPVVSGFAITAATPAGSNTPPVISAFTNVTVNEDTATAPQAFTIFDAEQPPAQLFLSAASTVPSVVPPGNIVFGGSGTNRTVTVTPATNASGTSVVSVIVSDTFNARATNSFTVTVLPVNDPPLVAITAPAGNSYFSVPATIGIQVAASDAEGPVLLVELFANGVLLTNWNAAPFNFTWSGMATGAYALKAVATDPLGAKATSAVVTANVILTPPYLRGINLGGPATVVEGQNWLSWDAAQSNGLSFANASWSYSSYGFALTPDPDAGTRTMLEGRLARIAPPDQEGFTLSQTITNGAYEVFVWTLENFQNDFRRSGLRLEGVTMTTNIGELAVGAWQKYGPYSVTVTDGVLDLEVFRSGKGDPMLCGLLIQSAGGLVTNTPPTISSITNQTINEDTATAALAFVIGDAESPPAQLTLAAQSSATNVIPAAGIVLGGGSGSNRTVTLTPATNATGVSTISLVVSDPAGASATNTFTVTVTALNDAPVVAISSPANNAFFAAPANIPVSVSASEVDGTITNVTLLVNGTNLASWTTPPYSLTWSNAPVGSNLLLAVATDNLGKSATSAVVQVTVSLTPPYSRGINLAEAAVIIEGQPWLSYAQAQADGLTVANATEANSPYGFTLVPAVDADTQLMLQGRLYRLNPPAGQGFSLAQAITNGAYEVFVWAVEDLSANFRAMNVFLEGVQVATNIGDLPLGQWAKYGPFPVVVTDGVLNLDFLKGSKGDPLACGILIRSAAGSVSNTPPNISSVTNQTIDEDTATGALAFSIGDAESTLAQLVLTKQSSANNVIPLAGIVFGGSGSNRTVTITPATNATGTSTVSLVVTDPSGASATNSFTVTVLPLNDPPSVVITTPANNAFFSAPATIPITVSASDVDGPITNVTLLLNGTNFASWTSAPYSITWSNVPVGSNAFVAVATDDLGVSATSAVVQVSIATTPEYSRGINLGGPATIVEGEAWLSWDAAQSNGLTYASASWFNGTYGFPLTPVPDASTLDMLEARVYRLSPPDQTGYTLSQTITNGAYEVYVWAIEDFQNNYRRTGLRLEGITATTNLGDLALGAWQKYGPFPVTVSDGVLDLEVFRSGKGDPMLCGLLIRSSGAANSAPGITLTNPANNAVFSLGNVIALGAAAFDPDTNLASVTFLDGVTTVGVVSNAPYTFAWTNAALGAHVLKAIATDSLGLAATSAVVNISVTNLAPSVTLTNPSNNAVFSLGNPITLAADASDPDGTIASVQFLTNGVVIATDTNAPFAVTWTNAALGAHTLRAIATDNFGRMATSAVVNISVTNLAPSVTLTNPSNNAVFSLGNPIMLAADASDPDGTIASVQFLTNGVVIATDTNAPFAFTWTNAALGAHTLRAIATDNFGRMATSAVVNISVTNLAPSVAVTNPADGAVLSYGQPVNIGASASDPDGALASVQLLVDGANLATLTNGPFTFAWTNATQGAHQLKAIATDAYGLATTSAVVSVTVTNLAPSVTLTNPADGAVFPLGTPIALAADAGDPDGAVASVQFLADNFPLATDTNAPFTFTWTNATAGAHTLKAVATDTFGLATTSAVVNISVTNLPPVVALTNPPDGSVFSFGNVITLGATAGDTNGNLATVSFMDGTTLLVTRSNAPFTVAWSNAALGAHALTAIATDALGLAATSAIVNISVTNLAPSVTVTNPTNGAVFSLGAPINIGADANDPDHSIASVQLLANGTPLVTLTNAPYTFAWTNAAEGAHALTAIATDTYGLAATSAVVNVTVSNAPPTASITSPVHGSMFALETTVALTAVASDPDGSVAAVNFFADGSPLGAGADGGTNWTLAWSNAPLGTFLLTAVATDNWGRGATSSPVSLRMALVPRLQTLRDSNGVIAVEVRGETNALYRISASSNLSLWLPVHTNTATNGLLLWLDPNPHDLNRCFYRAEPLP